MVDESVVRNLVELKEDETLAAVKTQLEAGTAPIAILDECREGMVQIGKRFEEGKYFLPELIMAGEIFSEAMEILQPGLAKDDTAKKGEIVLGTVEGDIHDIGKDIIVLILRGVGYEVHDLGVNVPPEKFIEKLRETGASLLGLSGLITTAYEGMKKTVEALVDAGLRDRVKVVVGGGLMNEKIRAFTGADAFGTDPIEAIELCRKLIKSNKTE